MQQVLNKYAEFLYTLGQTILPFTDVIRFISNIDQFSTMKIEYTGDHNVWYTLGFTIYVKHLIGTSALRKEAQRFYELLTE